MDTFLAEIPTDLPKLNETLNDILDMEVVKQENDKERNEITKSTSSGTPCKIAGSKLVPLDQTI